MKKFVLVLVSASVLLMLFACGKSSEKTPQQTPATQVPVKAITLNAADMPEVLSAPGTISAKTTSALASQIMAQVISVTVHEGDHVHAGQVLIILNAQELDARYNSAAAARDEVGHSIEAANLDITQAKANLDLVEATHERLKDLFDKKSISNQEFDESVAKLKGAQAGYDSTKARREQLASRSQQMTAEVRAAQINRGYSTILAPFYGVVVSRNVEPGVMAAPGSPLLSIEREGNYRLEASVEESHLAGIQRGQRIPVQIDSIKRHIEGRVSEVVPAADSQTRSFSVKIDLPATPGIHSGMFGTALFPNGHTTALSVPSDAVSRHGQLDSVLVVDNGIAHSRLVTTGTVLGPRVLVLSGLSDGDKLIYPIPDNVTDGTPVEVKK